MPILEMHEGGAPIHAANGTCYLCNTAPKGLWVRTTKDIDYEGELDICGTCAKELGNAVGLVSPDAAERERKKVKQLEDELARVQPLADAYTGLISHAAQAGISQGPQVSPTPRKKATSKASAKTSAKAGS